jgi:ABC-type amino acid transport substrate-binding protein
MKKLSTSLLLINLLGSGIALASANENIVKLGTKSEWKPYHINTPDGADGIAVRAFACIMARMNQPFIINKKPWARVQYETKQGKLDGFFSASRNSERDSYATLSKVFLPQQRSFYILKAGYGDKTLTLEYIKKNLTFAARAGSNALNSLIKKDFPVIVKPKSEEQLLKLLDKKRVGAILENSVVFDTLINKHGRSLSEFHKLLFEEKQMGVYFSHTFLNNNPDFLQKFNDNVLPCSLISKSE